MDRRRIFRLMIAMIKEEDGDNFEDI